MEEKVNKIINVRKVEEVWRNVVLLSLLVFMMLFSACLEDSSKKIEENIDEIISSPPKNLSGFILLGHIYGEDALNELYKMHGFSEELKKLKNASIMMYHKRNNVAYVWLGVAENEEVAEYMIKKMEDIISTNRTPYKIVGRKTIEDVEIIHTIGTDGNHYFFYIDKLTVWIYLREEDLSFIRDFINIIVS